MKNLKDCILSEDWTGVDHKPAFSFTPDEEFVGVNGPLNGQDTYDDVGELMDFFERFLICGGVYKKAAIATINGMSGLVKGFEEASKYVEDDNYKKAYKKMSLAVAKAQSNLKQMYEK